MAAIFLAAAALGFLVFVEMVRKFHRDVDFIGNLGFRHFPDDLTFVRGNFWTGEISAGRVAA